MSIFKRTQRKYVKKAYRVRNWREYEAGLRNRGSLTVWISLTAGKLVNWDASSRQSEGLLRSLFALMKLDNDVPDHTTISRPKAKLGKVPFYQDKQKTPLHILIDSSGLAVHAGQLRRAPKSRDYRKLHLCVDEALLHGPEQIADLPVPVAESPGAVRIGHPERSHLVEYLAPNSVFNSLPRQRSSPHLRPDDRLVTIDRVLHHASLGVA